MAPTTPKPNTKATTTTPPSKTLIQAASTAFKILPKSPEPTSIIYFQQNKRHFLRSFMGYMKDTLTYFLPIKKLPKWMSQPLYGDISFVFFIHPRRIEDYKIGLPFVYFLYKVLPKKIFHALVYQLPPLVVSRIQTPQKTGLVVSSIILPRLMVANQPKAINSAIKSLKFCHKLSAYPQTVIGLGAWWPSVTEKGKALQNQFKPNEIKITNGHSGTSMSIILMIKQMAKIANLPLSKLKLIVFGAGSMGRNLSQYFVDKVQLLTLHDINKDTLNDAITTLKEHKKTNTTTLQATDPDTNYDWRSVLNEHHIGICVTSSQKSLFKSIEIPDFFIFIDDARPESISRKLDPNRIMVLEGGIMKIKGLETEYDFGFGIDENVFGCLAETYALSCDSDNELDTTLGSVNINTIDSAISFYESHNIYVGDFKTGNRVVETSTIHQFMSNRHLYIRQGGHL